MIDLTIIDYAKDYGISFKDGETFGEIHSRIVEYNPSLHSRKKLQELSDVLINQIKNKFGLTELYVFAQYPHISTKEYHGFEEVYLYKHILEFMKDFTQAFCEKNQINEDLDKKVFQYEFQKQFNKKYGYIVRNTTEIGHWLKVIKKHNFDVEYIKFIELDLSHDLYYGGDKYFYTLDLTKKENIKQLYKVFGIFNDFDEYRASVFQKYDGYGNVKISI